MSARDQPEWGRPESSGPAGGGCRDASLGDSGHRESSIRQSSHRESSHNESSHNESSHNESSSNESSSNESSQDHSSPPESTPDGFAGRVALVTGAARGIGAATAGLLAARGAAVALFDCDDAPLAATAAQLRAQGARVLSACVDLTDAAAVDAAVAEVEQTLGPIEHLAHVAGILRVNAAMGAAPGTDLDDWDACMATNARAVVCVARAVAPRMVARGRGSIVAVGSNAATAPRMGLAAYAASKAAATQYLRCLALELAPRGVRCNVVSPGSTDTPMQQAFAPDATARQAILDGAPARFRLGIPLGRIADPQDVAEAIAFLLSDRARHITLHDLRVDGGATLDA